MSVHVLSWALRHSEAKLGQRLVLLVLADHAKDDGTCSWPSVATIARQANLSERQVQRCLRELEHTVEEIEPTGVSKYGTTIYTITGYVAFEEQGGRQSVTPGVTNAPEGVTPMSPDPSEEHPSEEETSPQKPPGQDVVPANGYRAWKVDRTPVTQDDDRKARAILLEWNEASGQSLTSRDWLAKIVMRVREHRELSLIDHRRIIRATLEAPWWKGPASPSVVYGNGAVFEQAMTRSAALDVPPGTLPIRPGGDAPSRFGRGMTTRQILDATGGEEAA